MSVKTTRRQIVTLTDLAPKQDIKGGSATRVFGAGLVEPPRAAPIRPLARVKPEKPKR
jgi:hypothetical protein